MAQSTRSKYRTIEYREFSIFKTRKLTIVRARARARTASCERRAVTIDRTSKPRVMLRWWTDLRDRVFHDENVGDGAKHAKVLPQFLAAGLPGEAADEEFAGCRVATVGRTPAGATRMATVYRHQGVVEVVLDRAVRRLHAGAADRKRKILHYNQNPLYRESRFRSENFSFRRADGGEEKQEVGGGRRDENTRERSESFGRGFRGFARASKRKL